MAPAPFINSPLAELARRDDTLIVFPHTQRTGGKALRDQVLCAAFGPARVYSASRGTGDKTWQDVTKADLDGFRVYTGPSNFADLDKGRPAVFVGLVRHPVHRAISLYYYCRSRARHKLHEIANRTSLEDFYVEASRINPPYIRNTQCLRMCGVADARKAQHAVMEKYVGVGFTEDVGAFGNALGAVLDWPQIKVQSAPSDDKRYDREGTPQFREIVLEENAEDMKLYLWMAAGAPCLPARKSLFSVLGSVLGGRRNPQAGSR